jgi:hypothetical protein
VIKSGATTRRNFLRALVFEKKRHDKLSPPAAERDARRLLPLGPSADYE